MRLNLKLFVLFFILAAFSRLQVDWPNWALVGAVTLWGSTLFTDLRFKLLLPLCILGFTDLFFEAYPDQIWVYIATLSYVFWGQYLKPQFGLSWLLSPLFGSLSFFIISNFGFWWSASIYEASIKGLLQCYALALPFVKATFISDFFGTLSVGVFLTYLQIREKKKFLAVLSNAYDSKI